jgi:hypothetical protein
MCPTFAKRMTGDASTTHCTWDNADAPAEYQRTMSMREYAYIPGDGSADLSIYVDSLDGIETLPMRVNHFGKRGSFVQFAGLEDDVARPETPDGGLAFEMDALNCTCWN